MIIFLTTPKYLLPVLSNKVNYFSCLTFTKRKNPPVYIFSQETQWAVMSLMYKDGDNVMDLPN